VRRINEGERVGMTVAQLVEVANVLEKYMVDRETCVEALKVATEKRVELTDAIAYVVMLRHGVGEIYSFDADFDKLEGIKRVMS
jgi:predicted nucleic acid-binding protein